MSENKQSKLTHTHRELCEIGAKFLKRPESSNGHGCHFAIVEASCYGENPDVFGVRHYYGGIQTFVLEAKTSRGDFLADKNKPHRLDPSKGMGMYRYFICPTDLIKIEELPDKWGLIYVNSIGHCKVVAGVLSPPKIKRFCQWSGKNKSHPDHKAVSKLFEDLKFEKRNVSNEMSLLTMALNRLGDVEDMLYLQRENLTLSTRVDQLNRNNRGLQNEVDRLTYLYDKSCKRGAAINLPPIAW